MSVVIILHLLMTQPPRLLDQVKEAARLKHFSFRTEKSYLYYIRNFILFHDKRHPKDMGTPEIEAFLTHLAVQLKVAASTQNQAFGALVFLYRHVLRQEIGLSIDAVRTKRSRHLSTGLTHEEAIAVLDQLSGTYQLVTKILYGSGLGLSEALQLRVKDLDFAHQQIVVRDGKGSNSRVTPLPTSLVVSLKGHLQRVQREPINKI
jgi:integrase